MKNTNTNDAGLRRGAARLAAVQALYQIDMGGGDADSVISDFLTGAIGGEVVQEDLDLETEEVIPLIALNAELFAVIVRGVQAMRGRLDEVINGSLSGAWDPRRLQPVLRNVLRCGLYELLEREEVPPRAAVSEYVDIARAFYEGNEPAMVNAVLDRLAHQTRPEEMEAVRQRRDSDAQAE